MVSSDGDGIYISNIYTSGQDSSVRCSLHNFISFGLQYCNNMMRCMYDDNINPVISKEEIAKFVSTYNRFMSVSDDKDMYDTYCDMHGTIGSAYLPINQYIYDIDELINSVSFVNNDYRKMLEYLVKISLTVVILFPDEFTKFLMMFSGKQHIFKNISSYGVSVFRLKDPIKSSMGMYFTSGSDKIKIVDDSGNEIILTPKVIRTSPSEVVNNIDSVDFSFMDNTVKSVTANIRSRIKTMRCSIRSISEQAYNKGYKAGIAVVSDLPPGWRVGSVPGHLDKYFIYEGLIRPKYINKNGITYRIPKAVSNLMYITSIAVPIRDTLGDCLAKGCHPHLNTSTDISEADPMTMNLSWGSLCIGDLSGCPFGRLIEIVPQMEIINIGSMYNGSGTNVVNILVNTDHRYEYDPDTKIVYGMKGNTRASSVAKHPIDSPWIIVYRNAAIKVRQSEIAREWDTQSENATAEDDSTPQPAHSMIDEPESTGNVIWNA